jgi:hypothetical protein
VNALDAALRKALRSYYPQIDEITLEDYKVRIINGQSGTAARTRVFIFSSDGHDTWGTVGVSDNIIEASWLRWSTASSQSSGADPHPRAPSHDYRLGAKSNRNPFRYSVSGSVGIIG